MALDDIVTIAEKEEMKPGYTVWPRSPLIGALVDELPVVVGPVRTEV